MNLLPWLVIPGAYLLGGVSPGYWLVLMRTGTDVRAQGSGATGATNAARSLGTQGFVMVMLLDTLKGAAAAALTRPAGLSAGWEFAAAAAVVAGHIWPVQLGFRGGRGFSPLLGHWHLSRNRRDRLGNLSPAGVVSLVRRLAAAGHHLVGNPQSPRRGVFRPDLRHGCPRPPVALAAPRTARADAPRARMTHRSTPTGSGKSASHGSCCSRHEGQAAKSIEFFFHEMPRSVSSGLIWKR
jgi:hypothetical protein